MIERLFVAFLTLCLWKIPSVTSFLSKSSSISAIKYHHVLCKENNLSPLYAAEEGDENDELAGDFLNFLKKNKEEINGQDDEEEEEEEEKQKGKKNVDENGEKKNEPSLIKEILSGKSTKFDRVVNDFVGKRYGAGAAFYGKRESDLSEEEYGDSMGYNDREAVIPDNEKILKDNAILIFGSLNQIGQWVAFELNEKGFQIRVACSDKQEAIKIFGLNNVDVVELKEGASEELYARAVQGVQAVVFCQNFQPKMEVMNKEGKAETAIARGLLDIAIKARDAGVGTLTKIVAVSRNVPQQSIIDGGNILNSFLQGQADSKIYSPFRDMHSSFERLVQESGFEYTVVRAPSIVEEVKIGAKSELVIMDKNGSPVDSARNLISNSIGMLDLTETVVQSLVLDIPNITFTVCESAKSSQEMRNMQESMPLAQSTAMDEEYGKTVQPEETYTDRVSRSAYYGILDMEDKDMKSSYLMKPAEIYRAQLDEDEQLEEYWQKKLDKVPRD